MKTQNTNLGTGYLVSVFVTALSLRLAFAFFAYSNNACCTPDSYDYINLADKIVQNFIYNSIFRAPVYPFFLAFIKSLFPSSFIFLTIIAQSILDSLTAVMVCLLSFRMFTSQPAALVSGLLYSVSPLTIQASSTVLSETLFNFFLLPLLLLLTINTNKKSVAFSVCIGLLMALLSITRVVFLPLTIVFLIFILIQTRDFKSLFVSGLACSVILLAWGLRNYISTGYKGISSVSAINTYRYNTCALKAQLGNKPFSQIQSEFDEKLLSLKTQKEQAEFASETGWRLILAHPVRYAVIQLKTSLNTLLPSSGDFARAFGYEIGNSGTLAVINSEGIIAGVKHYFAGNFYLFWLFAPLTLLLGIEYLFAVIGAIRAFKEPGKALTIFFIIAALYFIFIGGPASTPRFRIPAEPFIFLFAARGLKP